MKNLSAKVVVVLLTMALLVGGTVGGTVAWLSMKTDSVVNTFTVGNINIELKEHKLLNGVLTSGIENEVTANVENSYKILPGSEQPKDPFVRVKANSEACWLFVKIDETNNDAGSGKKYVSYTVDDQTWKTSNSLPPGVYYKEQEFTAADTLYYILKGNEVSYSSELTKDELDALDSNQPKFTFTAYAIQKDESFTDVVSAWNEVPKS